MHALPFVIAVVGAVPLAPILLKGLSREGHVRPNYRQRLLPFPFGLLTLTSAALALIPLALMQQTGAGTVFYPELKLVCVYVFGVGALGLIDDAFSNASRGWRGHAATTLRGGFSTGALKAAGSLGLALYVASTRELSTSRYLLMAAVLVLATNAFNLLDLRPGRSTKALVLLGAGLTIGAGSLKSLWALGLFLGPALVAGVYDLRERAMLGDTGANVLGALAGLWMVFSLSATGQLIALLALVLITVYGEIRSISALVERTPGLRELDSWGRPS